MDRRARLEMLFDGGDEELLKTNTELQSVLEIGTLSVEEQNTVNPSEINTPQTGQASASTKPAVEELSSSEDGFDEYLAAFSQASQKSKRKKKIHNKNDNICMGSTDPDLSILTFSHHTSGAAFCGNGAKSFCPISAVSRFPYKYVRGSDGDRIAQRFFSEGKFWKRSWDIYYIHPPPDISSRPLVLVPSHQVQDLIEDINKVYSSQLSIPLDQEPGFLIPFEDDGTPQPQYLGTSSSQDQKEEMELTIPDAPIYYHEPPKGCAAEVGRSFATFKAKMEAAVDATRKKNKAARKKRQGDRIRKLQGWCCAMKRTQCYLGMRPRRPRDLQPPATDGLTWEEQKRAEREYALACGIILLPLDVHKLAPFHFASEPIFICVDIEANEKDHRQITEIGVSTLDTLDLVGIPPGEGGSNWIAKIHSRHFRISEYSYVVNKEYVSGCPDSFEFGESEWISISEAAGIVDACFQPPYSAHTLQFPKDLADAKSNNSDRNGKYTPRNALQPSSLEAAPSKHTHEVHSIPEHKTRPRNLIFVGHDTETDLAYLRKLGCKSFIKPTANPSTSTSGNNNQTEKSTETPHFLETLDTSILSRVLKRETEAKSLGKILADLGIMGWNLHNGGNDARYTLEAMIGITLKSRLLLDKPVEYEDHSKMPTTNNWPLGFRLRSGTVAEAGVAAGQGMLQYEEEMRRAANVYDRKWEEEVERRVKAVMKDSESRVREECASWDLAVGEDSTEVDVDGGEGKGLGG
ncbi:hypothetical protein EMCG_08276 [[Emmonsia] crescens]|uniref:Gfd2/YDR514C-like C-terminal domain-containing protein n=1 Tax=[Emmonsia] crescens TaxID=73230 RepID=A0A0G2I5T9_9EURO|nr:hypothetical protein EMCG_08276 [Emmonsia crescens UAMH 3008]